MNYFLNLQVKTKKDAIVSKIVWNNYASFHDAWLEHPEGCVFPKTRGIEFSSKNGRVDKIGRLF